eukprot:gene2287-2241_t
MFSAYSPRAANAYQRINVETSMHTMDQHQLVSLLYEGVLNSIATARGAMARGDVLGKVNAISKAVRILEEGLSTSLDKVDGGELAQNLGALYDYCIHRLILANARNDDALMQEVMRLIEPVATGWSEIKKSGLTMSHMLIDYYKAIEDSSAKMLEAAKLKDWDGVVRYEGACAVLIEQLRFKSQEHELLPEHRREKTRIMQRILRNDAQIRCLAEPWLAQFEHLFEGQPQMMH